MRKCEYCGKFYSAKSGSYCSRKCAQEDRKEILLQVLNMDNDAKLLSEWSKYYSIPENVVVKRIKNGYTPEEAVKLPYHLPKQLPLSEDQVQFGVCNFLDTKGIDYWHTPNETWTSSWATKIKNKRMGVKSGIPDLTILIPIKGKKNKFFTLYLELKTETGTMSDTQKEWQKKFGNVESCEFRCCQGLDDAIDMLEYFLYGFSTQKKSDDVF